MDESGLMGAVERALDLPHAERRAFLEREFAAGEELDRALRMLAACEVEDSFLDRPVRVDLVGAPAVPARRGRLAAGDRVADYEVREFLAAGGMGEVYLAEQHSPRRQVALKLLGVRVLDASALERFRLESEVLARLQHPSIATVYASGVGDVHGESVPYLALEHVEGARGLVAYAEQERLDVGARVRLFLQVCDGVSHGHQRGVIHRDLKPNNLLVDREGRAKVIDYGIALELDRAGDDLRLTRGAQVIGTLGYMSPEQLDAPLEVDTRADVYALGAVLYELLGGAPPFDLGSTSFSEAIRIVTTVEPEPLSRRNPDVPRELGWVVEKALRKDRDERYGSVDDLARDLRRFLGHQPVSAAPLGRGYRLRKFVRRNRVACALGAAAVVSAATGGAAALLLALDLAGAEAVAEARAADASTLAAWRDIERLVREADRLWPIRAERAPDYERWLDEAQLLVDGRAADEELGTAARPGLDELGAKLEELQALARPEDDPDALELAREHPRSAALREARARRTWMRRMLGREAWPDVEQYARQVEANTYLAWVHAWERVGPDALLLDEATEGWASARAAVTAREQGEMHPQALMSLAWAHARHGRPGVALETAREALRFDGIALLDEEFRRLEEFAERWREEERDARAAELAHLEQRIVRLELEVGERVIDDVDAGWWQAQLAALVSGIEDLHDPRRGLARDTVAAPSGWGIARRLQFARALAPDSDASRAARPLWEEAIAAIAVHPAYGGLSIEPQVGLLPLGPDPDSGLWEFAHLPSGVPAERGPDGRLVLREDSGVVLVLLPAGTFWMGAQPLDPDRPNYDPRAWIEERPVHEVELSAFFLSKYELTQRQWFHARGSNPSHYTRQRSSATQNRHRKKVTWLHPVEQVTWLDCRETLRRLDLDFPTEAQWEYGCRAGTSDPLWCGEDSGSLVDVGNVADQFAKRHEDEWGFYEQHDDGYTIHAPVGSFRPNPFGLHDVHGNVEEWCLDDYTDSYKGVRGPDPAGPYERSGYKVLRGGGFNQGSKIARASTRMARPSHDRAPSVGLRPARALRP